MIFPLNFSHRISAPLKSIFNFFYIFFFIFACIFADFSPFHIIFHVFQKVGGTFAMMSPPLQKVGGTSPPRPPRQRRPWLNVSRTIYIPNKNNLDPFFRSVLKLQKLEKTQKLLK